MMVYALCTRFVRALYALCTRFKDGVKTLYDTKARFDGLTALTWLYKFVRALYALCARFNARFRDVMHALQQNKAHFGWPYSV
jgi:hypothetical protein